MSFLSDVFELGKQAVSWFTGDSVGANIAKTVASGFVLNQVTKSINRDSAVPQAAVRGVVIDEGARLQVNPDPEHAIPVVYGTATLGGAITHVEVIQKNTLYAVFTISERTGVKLSDGQQSSISFDEIRVNDQRVVFKAGGQVVDYTLDRDGNIDNSLNDLMEIRCFNNGSSSPVQPVGTSGGNMATAFDFLPSWTSTDTMTNLAFVVIKLTYNRDRGVTRIPLMSFRVSNSMRLPGDCIRDYMTNTRYGAGIPAQEIYSE
jgi:hypothetical protein